MAPPMTGSCSQAFQGPISDPSSATFQKALKFDFMPVCMSS